jgi:hypothetical protein
VARSISSGALIEAEQLVLAPSQVDAEKVLQMFGLRGGLQVRPVFGQSPMQSVRPLHLKTMFRNRSGLSPLLASGPP